MWIPYVSAPGSIAGFAIAPDGALQPIPGSPYAGPAFALAANAPASALYAASGSSFNVDRINSDGSLTTTATFNSQPLTQTIGAYEDLSFDAGLQFLYAEAIHGSGDNFFEIYKSSSDGSLTASGSQQATVAVSHLSFTPDGARAYESDCYHLDGDIFGYTVGSNGTLTPFNTKASVPNLGAPYPSCPIALAISADGERLATPLNAKIGGGGAIATYAINSDGTLTIQGSPLPTTAQAADIAWDASGRYVAVAAKNGLWVYSVPQNGTPTALEGTALVGAPIDHVAFNKTGTLLFATSASAKMLYVFTFDSTSGLIAPASGSPHQMNVAPYELAIAEP